MQGWIKLHRKIMDNEIWSDPTTFRLFTLLLIKASHTDGFVTNGVTLNKGQYIRSYSKLSEDLAYKEGRGIKKVSKSTIKRSIDKLITNNIITVHETGLGTLFTVLKYHLYQEFEVDNETKHRTEDGTKLERRQNEVGTNPELYQELKNLEEEEEERANAFTFYQQNFGVANPFILDSIGMWIDDTSEEIVIEAMKEGLRNNARTFKYCETILRDWSAKGVKNASDLKSDRPKQHPKVTPITKKQDNLSQLDAVFKKMGLRKEDAL